MKCEHMIIQKAFGIRQALYISIQLVPVLLYTGVQLDYAIEKCSAQTAAYQLQIHLCACVH